jgi:plasmid stabilization system protein ParE
VPKLRYSAAAKDDLDSIAEYVARESANREVAEECTRDLRQKCRDLARAPILRVGHDRREQPRRPCRHAAAAPAP